MGQCGWRVALLAALLLVVHPALAADLAGRVVALADGDTLTILTDAKEQVRIRLAEVDMPERGQPYASRAGEHLSDLVFNKQVRAEDR